MTLFFFYSNNCTDY